MTWSSGISLRLPALLLAATLCACGAEEERQPSAAEIQRYTAEIDRREAEATAKAIRASRAEEKLKNDKHLERVPAAN